MLAISRMRDLVARKHKWKKNCPSHLAWTGVVIHHWLASVSATSCFFHFCVVARSSFGWLILNFWMEKPPNSCALRKHVQCGQSHLLSWNSGCGEPHQWSQSHLLISYLNVWHTDTKSFVMALELDRLNWGWQWQGNLWHWHRCLKKSNLMIHVKRNIDSCSTAAKFSGFGSTPKECRADSTLKALQHPGQGSKTGPSQACRIVSWFRLTRPLKASAQHVLLRNLDYIDYDPGRMFCTPCTWASKKSWCKMGGQDVVITFWTAPIWSSLTTRQRTRIQAHNDPGPTAYWTRTQGKQEISTVPWLVLLFLERWSWIQRTSDILQIQKKYRYIVHIMAFWADPTKNRAKIRNRKRIHRSLAECRQPRTSNLWRLCCIWFLKTRLLYILGLDNCKAGVQKLEGAFPYIFQNTPRSAISPDPFACLRWSSCSRSGSREFELWSAAWIRSGSLIFHVEGSGVYHSAWTGDFPSHAGQHDW